MIGDKLKTFLPALLAGHVDALFLVAATTADTVYQLNQSAKVKLLSFDRADAYTRRIPTLTALSLPQGALDLGRDEPKQDLLMQAAAHVHGGSSLFSTAGEFPTPLYTAMPLSKEAARYYKSGPSFLQRYLPFWAATLVDRLKVMLLPFIALLIPLFKVMPPLYRWRVRSRIYRWYEELGRIDEALADELYNLRVHLSLIRQSAERIKG